MGSIEFVEVRPTNSAAEDYALIRQPLGCLAHAILRPAAEHSVDTPSAELLFRAGEHGEDIALERGHNDAEGPRKVHLTMVAIYAL